MMMMHPANRKGASMDDAKPLIAESSTSESTTVEVVLNDIRDDIVRIPDYQRDSDQWDEPTKSLLVESVINNLSVPAFFFEVRLDGGVERNEVIDGQQRLTTLDKYYRGEFPLVGSEDAPYISPNSIHYAGKNFGDLPAVYKQAFKKYRLAVIKLRNLEGEMRLEIFRRDCRERQGDRRSSRVCMRCPARPRLGQARPNASQRWRHSSAHHFRPTTDAR
jgi:hypothetical protein